jgi:hypothetical protein
VPAALSLLMRSLQPLVGPLDGDADLDPHNA